MKKIKNKFIIGLILLVLLIVSYQIYKYYDMYKVDTNSYAILVNGKGEINNKTLYENEKKVVKIGDKIKTIGKNSILVLEWGDKSITRLGGDTVIVVNENYISKDLTKINVSFNLLNGKTWSNVISFIGQDSYFREYFNDIEAGVRGTVFDVNLDNNYIFVTNHEVSLKTKSGKVYKVGQGKPFSIKTLSFIDLQKFILTIKDKAWNNFNSNLDKEFINNLKSKLINSIKNNNGVKNGVKLLTKANINSLNLKDKEKAYNDLLSKYQKYNFVDTSNKELFKVKMQIKSSLILLANNDNKINLLRTVVYDINNAIESKKESLIKDFLPLLKKYKINIPILDLKKLNNTYKGINNFIGTSGDNIGNKVKSFLDNFKK